MKKKMYECPIIMVQKIKLSVGVLSLTSGTPLNPAPGRRGDIIP